MPTKTGKKYIICDAAPSSWGKTTTLKAVSDLFETNPLAFNTLSKNHKLSKESWIVFQEITTSKTILIQTQGDQKQSFNDTKKYLSEKQIVDIIICASRPDGPSWKAVEWIIKNYGYKLINFRNFCPFKKNRRSLFKISAISDINKVHLAQLIYNFALAL